MGRFQPELSQFLKTLSDERKKRRVVFTNGCFDLLHVGHIRYLQDARNLGDYLVVGINSDASVKKLKGPARPLQNELDRLEIIAALECVNLATLFGEDTPEALIRHVRPDVLVKGGDWPIEKIAGAQFVLSYGGEVRSLQFVEGHSTTGLIKKMDHNR